MAINSKQRLLNLLVGVTMLTLTLAGTADNVLAMAEAYTNDRRYESWCSTVEVLYVCWRRCGTRYIAIAAVIVVIIEINRAGSA